MWKTVLCLSAMAGAVCVGDVTNVAAFRMNDANDAYESSLAAANISGLTYLQGSGLTVGADPGGMRIDQFSISTDFATALSSGSWLQFTFDTAAGNPVSFDKLFMRYDFAVNEDQFKIGVAYDNGSGSFAETIEGISAVGLSGGGISEINLGGFSQGQANSTLRFRVVYYADQSVDNTSALFATNDTLNGVADSSVVFQAVPEPASALMIGLGGAVICLIRRFYGRC